MKRLVGVLAAVLAPVAVWAGLSSQSYVQSGLVLQLDGINNDGSGTHNAAATAWKDLKGSSDFTVNASCASFTGGNGLKKNNVGYMAKCSTKTTGVLTLETAISGVPSSGWLIATMIDQNHLVSFANNGANRQYTVDNKHWGLTVSHKTDPVTVAAVYSSTQATGLYENGTLATGSSYLDYWTGNSGGEMSLGGRSSFDGSDKNAKGFSLHAVRFYNRVLTATEAQHNAVVDAIRFHNTTPDNYQVSGDVLQWRITATAGANGMVAIDGGAAGSSAASDWVTSDGLTTKTVTLVATPSAGCGFSSWTGDTSAIVTGSVSSPTITVTTDRACALTANFAGEGWTGAGADTKITTVENWASATDLTGGTAIMKVKGGMAATLPADGTDYAFKGVSAEKADFIFDAEAGAKPVTLGACGFTNTVGGVTWGWPTVLGASQVWYSGAGASMDVRANVGGSGTWTFYGQGRVNWYGTNTFSGTVNVGNDNGGAAGQSCLHLYPDAKLAVGPGSVKVGSAGNSYGLWLHGVTLDSALVVGTANSTTRMGVYSDEGVTNIINGKLSTQYANNAFWGLKGVTICRGGVELQTGSDNKQQRTNPFASAKSVFRVEQSPMKTHLMELNQGRLELAVANNAFQSLGLRIVGGTLKTEVPYASKAQNQTAIASANSIGLRSGTWDLGGGDQSVDYFFGEGGTITSATSAQLHDIVSAAQPNRALKSDVYSNFGQDVTVCKSVFTGGAGLAKEGALDLYIAAANTSTGRLTAVAGRLILSAANSAAQYPDTSITKTQGSWAGRVEVTGGTLVIEHASALGPNSEVYVSGGSIEIAEGVVLPAMALYVTDGQGGWTAYRGTCGGAASGAAQQPTLPGTGAPVFSGKGTICVGATLPGGWPTTATPANWVEQGADKLVTTAANWDPSTASVHDGSLFARIAAGTQAKLPDNDFAFIQGLTVSQPNFSFAPGAGTTLFLGKAGLTNATTGVVWNWPASIGSFEPLWWLAKDSTMELRAPLAGTGKLKIWGGGRLDVYSTNTIQGTVYVGDNNDQSANPAGEVYVYLHPGATLAAKGGTVSIGCRGGWGLHLMGNTLDCNVIAGTQNNTKPAALFVEPNTTNVINGLFQTQFANVSSMSLKGTLVLRGGAEIQTVGGNPYNSGGYFTFWNNSDCAGTLRIEEKPLHSSRIHLPRGMIDLATTGNQFRLCGLRIIGGTLRTSVPYAIDEQSTEANRNIVYLESGAWDLAGNDQRINYFYGKGGQVSSASLAQLHLKDDLYWKCSKTPALSFGATGTVCQAVFMGGAGLSKEGSLDFYIASANSSTGTLAVTKGKLVMSGYSASATYPGTTIKKSYGAWRAGTVEVTGGTLLVEHKDAFSKETTLVVAGGTVELAPGVRAKVGALVVGGNRIADGVYGGPDSAAPNKLDCFSGTGVIRVGDVGLRVIVAGATGSNPMPDQPSALTLRFGVLSDVHITRRGNASDTYSYGSAQTFVHTLQYFKEQNVDAVVLAGDMADRGLPENLQVVADAWREVFPDDRAADGRPVERVFIYGNHDADKSWFENASGQLAGKTEDEKAALIARSISHNEADAWRAAWGEEWSPAYMKTIKGYRFIAAHWGHESQAVDLINEHCFDLAGSKPFFYVQHPQLTDGFYGKYAWNPATGPTSALTAYPNAITFSGHIHYSTSLEASIYQKDFTSIGTASLSYISKFEEGLNRSDSDTTRNGREALLVSVYGNRVVVKRREFVKDADLGPDWTIEPGSVTGAAPYTYAHEQERLAAPEFPVGATVTAVRTDAGLRLTLPQAVFDAAHARVPFYDLVFKSGLTTLYSCTLQQDGFFAPFGDVPATTTYTIPKATFDPPEGFTLEIRARDFYGRTSAPLVQP